MGCSGGMKWCCTTFSNWVTSPTGTSLGRNANNACHSHDKIRYCRLTDHGLRGRISSMLQMCKLGYILSSISHRLPAYLYKKSTLSFHSVSRSHDINRSKTSSLVSRSRDSQHFRSSFSFSRGVKPIPFEITEAVILLSPLVLQWKLARIVFWCWRIKGQASLCKVLGVLYSHR